MTGNQQLLRSTSIALTFLVILNLNFGYCQTDVSENAVVMGVAAARTEFLRVASAADATPQALELAIVHYIGADSISIDLVAVVHLGEREYYRQIDSVMVPFEVVLYEGVSSDSVSETVVWEKDKFEQDPMYRRYRRLAKLFGFVGQLDGIDYSRSNFVHADLRWAELRRRLESENVPMPDFSQLDTAVTILEGKLTGAPPTVLREFRRQMAQGFASKRQNMAGRPEFAIEIRNDHVLDILRAQLRSGKKRIAILYGADHMPDLHAHLLNDFGMTPSRRWWLEAWNLR